MIPSTQVCSFEDNLATEAFSAALLQPLPSLKWFVTAIRLPMDLGSSMDY